MPEEHNNVDYSQTKGWRHAFKKPATIVVGTMAIACSTLGYAGMRWLVREKLPPFLEQQLSRTFERPLDLGEVESFSLNSITFGESTVSVNDDDPDYVTVDQVQVKFNVLPVLTRRVLPLTVTLIDPDIYLEQDNNGTWLQLPGSSESGRGLPIDFDITVIAQSGEVVLQSNHQTEPVKLQLDGGVNYDQSQPDYIRYDLDTAIGEVVGTIIGKTGLKTGKTKAQILLEDLSLSKITALLPNEPPANIRQGNLNAEINLTIPSWSEIDDTRIQGTASLQQFQATAKQLDKPINAQSRLRFQEEKIKLNQTQASIGDIIANIDGRISWETGYDVSIAVPAFAINKLEDVVGTNLPIDIAGQAKANLQLIGGITKPVLKGSVSNAQPIIVAETKLNEVVAELTASLDQVVLENLNIIPTSGGEITGQGIIGIGSDKITSDSLPLSLQFQANLPTEKLLEPYYVAGVPFNIGTVTAEAKVNGTIAEPKILVDWQAPTVATSAQADIAGSGEIMVDDTNVAINNTEITIDSGELDLNGTVDFKKNTWQGVLTANNVTLNPFLQPLSERLKLEEPVALQRGTIRLNGELTSQPLDTLDGVANLNFDVGNGDVLVRSEINAGRFQAIANATAVPVNNFWTGVELSQSVDAQVDLSASLDSPENTAVDLNNLAIEVGEENLNATGEIVIANADIANIDLDVQADSNLSTIPNQLLKNIAANNQFLARNFNLAGNASFDGRIQGQNLLTQPDNLDLTGNLQLEDLSIGNTAFAALSGTVDISPGEAITFDLKGEQDVIAVNLEPCAEELCPLPYLPNDLEIRQGEDTNEPIVATANRQGDLLDLELANFPLSILNLQAGVPGKIAGEATGKALVNLFTLATEGEVQVIEPRIGYIDGEVMTADFVYLPQQNLARLDAATLEFGESIYTIEGAYNFQTQAIEGELDIPQAYVQDLVAAFGWYDLQRVTELFKPPDLANSADLAIFEVGEEDPRVGSLIKLLVIVTERLEQMANDSDFLATSLDITGAYQGEIAIAGSLNSPQVAWSIVGDDWLWDTSQDIVFEIPRRQGIIAIEGVAIEGSYAQEAVTFDTLSIQGTKSAIALQGKLQQGEVSGEYDLTNIPIDAIENFVDIPFEVSGRVSTKGQVSQTLQNPNLVGDVKLENATLSDRQLPKITGKYVYNHARLELDTTETAAAQIQASIPFPIKPGNDRVSLMAEIDEGGVALIDGFTGGALEFIGGEADITLDANARLDLDADFIFQDLDATAEASLNNSILKTSAVKELLNVTAEIAMDEKLIQVDQLTGTFADSDIAASGVLSLVETAENTSESLTVTIYESEINLDQLYKGGIAGEIVITGNAFSPLIGGEIELFDGRAFIPQDEEEIDEEGIVEAELTLDQQENVAVALNEEVDNTKENAFTPKLKDLAVTLADFKVQQTPLYRIILEGDLILNGAANNVPEIKADGKLQLTRADVDFVSNEFNLQPDYENVVVFNPDTTILNPFIDVKLETEVAEYNDIDLGVVDDNEIPDPISQSARNEIINVTLNIEGEAEQIIPRTNENFSNLCIIDPPFKLLFDEEIYEQEELNKLAECINGNAFSEGSALELLNSPAVELSSNPPRSQGAILSLLGNRFLSLVEQLQDSNEEQLFEFGVTQFILTPIEREAFSFTDGIINNVGEQIGLDYFQVYPAVEGTYQLNEDSSVNATYDYFFDEVRIRYQQQF